MKHKDRYVLTCAMAQAKHASDTFLKASVALREGKWKTAARLIALGGQQAQMAKSALIEYLAP